MTVQQVLGALCLLSSSDTQQYIVLSAYALLGLQLSADKVAIDILHITYASKGHLLFDIVAKPFAPPPLNTTATFFRWPLFSRPFAVPHTIINMDTASATLNIPCI